MLGRRKTLGIILVIIIVSYLYVLFDEDLIGEYYQLFSMATILIGIIVSILLIIDLKKGNDNQTKIDRIKEIFPENKEEKKICLICNTENKITAEYCTKCGSDLKDIECPICNTINPFDQKYCTKCDTILQNVKRH